MSEMVERVAKALADDDAGSPVQAHHRRRAHIAIAAMREPTREMGWAGAEMAPGGNDAVEVWHLMIDAALKE